MRLDTTPSGLRCRLLAKGHSRPAATGPLSCEIVKRQGDAAVEANERRPLKRKRRIRQQKQAAVDGLLTKSDFYCRHGKSGFPSVEDLKEACTRLADVRA